MNKEKINVLINFFTRISTGIFLFSGIYICIFYGFDPGLSVSYIFGVLGMSSLFAVVGTLIYSKETATKNARFIQGIIFFIFVNIVVLGVGFLLHWFSFKNLKTVIGMEITIFIVFFVVTIVTYRIDIKTANKMNEKLKERKKS